MASKKNLATLLPLALIFLGELQAESVPTALASEPSDIYVSRISFGTRQGDGIGYEGGYTSGKALLFPRGDRGGDFAPVPFFDLRVHVVNDARTAASAGFGMRFPIKEREMAFGFNCFYDYRQADIMALNQIGFGLELLTDRLTLRANGYLPIGPHHRSQAPTNFTFVGNQIFGVQRSEASLPTIESELAWTFFRAKEKFELEAAIGPYYLFKEKLGIDSFGGAVGVQGRLKATFLDMFEFGVQTSSDRVFGRKVEGFISWSTPVGGLNRRKKGGCAPSYFSKKMAGFVARRELIVRDSASHSVPVLNSGKQAHFVHFEAENGAGTFEAPHKSLIDAIDGANERDLIVILSGGKSFFPKGIYLKPGQTLHGGGHDIWIDGLRVPAPAIGMNPVISSATFPAVVMASNSTIKGVTIENDGGPAIWTNGARNLHIENVDIKTIDGNGLYLQNVKGFVEMKNVTISGMKKSDHAILIDNTGGSLDFVFTNGDIREMPLARESFLINLRGDASANVTFDRCAFTHVGNYAISGKSFDLSKLNLNVKNCTFEDAVGPIKRGGIALIGQGSGEIHFNLLNSSFRGLMQDGILNEGVINVAMHQQSLFSGSIKNCRITESNQSGFFLKIVDKATLSKLSILDNKWDGLNLGAIQLQLAGSGSGNVEIARNRIGMEKWVERYGIKATVNGAFDNNYTIDIHDNRIQCDTAIGYYPLDIEVGGTSVVSAKVKSNTLQTKRGDLSLIVKTVDPTSRLSLRLERNQANKGSGNFILRNKSGEFVLFGRDKVDGENDGVMSIAPSIIRR